MELIKEIDSFPSGQFPDYEDFKKMKYITGVINESLRFDIQTYLYFYFYIHINIINIPCISTFRLYPPVPSDPKQALKDDTLPNGYKVTAGVLLTLSYMSSHNFILR